VNFPGVSLSCYQFVYTQNPNINSNTSQNPNTQAPATQNPSADLSDSNGPTLSRANPNFVATGIKNYSATYGRYTCQVTLPLQLSVNSPITGDYTFQILNDNSSDLAAHTDARFSISTVRISSTETKLTLSSLRSMNDNYEVPYQALLSVIAPNGTKRFFCLVAFPLVALQSSSCTQTLNDQDNQTMWTITPLASSASVCIN
jgi:hypothetical protein